MSEDPYKVLSVSREAKADEIRSAYRRLAKKHHPDLNPGNKAAEEAFKAASAAYAIIGDEEKRKRFDKGEIDASGQERPERGFYRQYAEGTDGRAYGPFGAGAQGGAHSGAQGFEGFENLNDLFGDYFSRSQGARGGRGFRARGADVEYTLSVDFLDAVKGAKRRLNLPDGSSLDVTIPAGVEEGQALRLSGKGNPGFGGGVAGDAYVHISIRPHPFFRREGKDLHLEVPVTLAEALKGAKIEVPTPAGAVSLTIPKASNTGTKLRLKAKGIAKKTGTPGDLYVTLKVMLPEKPDAELADLVERWEKTHAYNVRRDFGGSK